MFHLHSDSCLDNYFFIFKIRELIEIIGIVGIERLIELRGIILRFITHQWYCPTIHHRICI